MSLNKEKKAALVSYLLELIERGDSSPVSKTAANFEVTPATVYRYLDELTADGTIRKIKRGEYELQVLEHTAHLKRSAGELVSEHKIYERHIKGCLAELPANVRQIWDYICGEMINNVIDHSEAEDLEITVMQDRLKTTVRIADNGVGIFEKIRKHFGLDSNEEAVGELFKGKLTTDSAHHSGEGIFFSSRLADSFAIISSGLVFSRDRFDPDVIAGLTAGSTACTDSGTPGTVLCISLANNSAKQAKDVFDTYSNPDGRFTRTRIPLKDYFDSSPVSRSQAKRLCSGLDRFKEVLLDFEGIEWMGQGFAHQLFCVYAGEWPDVKLIPLNMNEDVTKMYVHVKE